MRKIAIALALALALSLISSASADRIIPCRDSGDSIVREDKNKTSDPIDWEQYQLCANQGIAVSWFEAFEIGRKKDPRKKLSEHQSKFLTDVANAGGIATTVSHVSELKSDFKKLNIL